MGFQCEDREVARAAPNWGILSRLKRVSSKNNFLNRNISNDGSG